MHDQYIFFSAVKVPPSVVSETSRHLLYMVNARLQGVYLIGGHFRMLGCLKNSSCRPLRAQKMFVH